MVSGAEAVDTACKIARKWGFKRKGIAPQEALVLSVAGSYHGLTAGVWGLTSPTPARTGKCSHFMECDYALYVDRLSWRVWTRSF